MYLFHPKLGSSLVHADPWRLRCRLPVCLSMQSENSYWHDSTVTAYRSKAYRRFGGDIDKVYKATLEARDKVGKAT